MFFCVKKIGILQQKSYGSSLIIMYWILSRISAIWIRFTLSPLWKVNCFCYETLKHIRYKLQVFNYPLYCTWNSTVFIILPLRLQFYRITTFIKSFFSSQVEGLNLYLITSIWIFTLLQSSSGHLKIHFLNE